MSTRQYWAETWFHPHVTTGPSSIHGTGLLVCRATVRGDDWRLPELRERYRGRFLPYIERRFAAA